MAHVTSINIHDAEDCRPRAVKSGDTEWLEIEFLRDDGEGVARFTVSVFMPLDRAQRLADAINLAWPDRAGDDGRPTFITWVRPSYHRPSEGLRAEDVLPDDGWSDEDEAALARCTGPLDALNGADPEAA